MYLVLIGRCVLDKIEYISELEYDLLMQYALNPSENLACMIDQAYAIEKGWA